MMYPILLKAIEKKMIWGSESWSVSCRNDEMCIVENGAFKDKSLGEVIKSDKAAFLGHDLVGVEAFPLLVKVIAANDSLSIQVHPNDEYAKNVENDPYGKTEMWYILDAPKDAFLIVGLKDGVTKGELKEALENGNCEELFNKLPIKKGDVINIPAGLAHAITAGVRLIEIQQNSDRTYRVYDYNRVGFDGKPRELHIEKALDVMDFDGKIEKKATDCLSIYGNETLFYIKNKYFACEKYIVTRKKYFETDGLKFWILTNVGTESVKIIYNGKKQVELLPEKSAFIPAAMGRFVVLPSFDKEAEMLLSYVPSAPQADLRKYAALAKECGAVNAIFVPPSALKFDGRTLLKCMYGCDDWGYACTCPSRPGSLSSREYEKLLKKYNYVLIIHAHDKKTTQEASFAVEKAAFLDGDALAFSMSDCSLCARCMGHFDKPCANPQKARPALHSVGIDVFKTVKAVGLPINTLSDPDKQEQNWYSAVFLNDNR